MKRQLERQCRYVPLSQHPLVLVLAQVRFSAIRQMDSYLPGIQEAFRRHGFPLEQEGKVQQITFSSMGGVPLHVVEEQRWEYRTKNETSSIILTQDRVVLQSTEYDRFERFAETLLFAVRTVFEKTEHDQLGVVERVGLRYVDVVVPREGEDFRAYLRPGLHGVADDANQVFQSGTHRLFVESRGRTSVGTESGTMMIRVFQNDQGFSLPPDLIQAAPKHESRSKPGELITLIDMDHFVEGHFEPDADWVVETAYLLHDHLVETFHEHVVTPAAIETWK